MEEANGKIQDHLKIDPPLLTECSKPKIEQKWAVVSFISPEDRIKERTVYEIITKNEGLRDLGLWTKQRQEKLITLVSKKYGVKQEHIKTVGGWNYLDKKSADLDLPSGRS